MNFFYKLLIITLFLANMNIKCAQRPLTSEELILMKGALHPIRPTPETQETYGEPNKPVQAQDMSRLFKNIPISFQNNLNIPISIQLYASLGGNKIALPLIDIA